MLFSSLFSEYEESIKISKSQGTFSFVSTTCLLILKEFQILGIKKVFHLNSSSMKDFFNAMRSKGLSNSTIGKRISLLKRILNFRGFFIKGVSDFPVVSFKQKSFNPVPRDSLLKLMNYFRGMDESAWGLTRFLIFMILFYTGVRSNELVHIKVRNIDFYYCCIFLDFTKSGESRVVFFDQCLVDPLKKYIQFDPDREFLFKDFRFGKEFDTGNVSAVLRWACKKLKIPRVHPHQIRHSFATMLVENGCPLASLQYLMGHKDPVTTEIYLHLSVGFYKSEFQKFFPKI